MPTRTAADRELRRRVQAARSSHLDPVTGAVPGKGPAREWVDGPSPPTCQCVIAASPAAQRLPSPRGASFSNCRVLPNPKPVPGSQNHFVFLLILLLFNFLEDVDWLFAAWLHLQQSHPA